MEYIQPPGPMTQRQKNKPAKVVGNLVENILCLKHFFKKYKYQ